MNPRDEKRGANGPTSRGAFPGEKAEQSFDPERAAAIKDTQERIAFIVDLMSDVHYLRRTTVRALAIAWGISTHRVDQLSQSAAAVLRAAIGGFEPIRTRCILGITRIHEETFERARNTDDDFTAAKMYEVSLKATEGMLAFTSHEFNEHLSTMKEKRDAEKHTRDMKDGPSLGGGPAVQVILNRGPVDEDGAPKPDEPCSKSS